eukprot:TRINITY_DN3634_c0_g1_i2.p1 TRINITY_DN3634_c0_g1~~TRINITY_DN3634_c0_g1_i2.p1  ORF type:complete len:270 (+),score=68.41 TRINITY_DN3634_c0_g1_i2:43-852(+)
MAGDFSDLEKRLAALKQKDVAPPAPTGAESRLASLKGPEPKPVSESTLWNKLEKLKGEQCATDPRRGDYQYDDKIPESKEDQVNNLLSEVKDAVRLGIVDDDVSRATSDSSLSSDETSSSSSSCSSSTHSSDASQQRRRKKKAAAAKSKKALKKQQAADRKRERICVPSSKPPPSFKPDPAQQAAIRKLFGNMRTCNEKKETLMGEYESFKQRSENGIFIATDSDKNGIRKIFGLPEKVSSSMPVPSAPDISDADVDAVLREVMKDVSL